MPSEKAHFFAFPAQSTTTPTSLKHPPRHRHEQRPATDSHAARRARSRPDRHLVAGARYAAQPRPARHRHHRLPTAKRLLGAGPAQGAGHGRGPRRRRAAPQPGRLLGDHRLSAAIGRLGAGTAQPLAKLAQHRQHRGHDAYPDLLVAWLSEIAIHTLFNSVCFHNCYEFKMLKYLAQR